MHKSPSLFFDILAEVDEQKRDEKIRRASFEIKKSAHTCSPPHSKRLPQLQQHLLAHAAPVADDAAAAADCSNALHAPTPTHDQPASPQQQQQQQEGQQQQQLAAFAHQQAAGPQQQVPQQLVLSPQEVLQELLGDLYIDHSRLEMGALLGQGGFADVHAAELSDSVMPAFRESVAVKRLRPDVLKSPDDLREFLTEANLLRKLQHRNIVRLRGVGATDLTDLVAMRESMFVVQEFMAGGDLKQMVLSGMSSPFDPPYTKVHAFTWAMHIAEAMHYLHRVCSPMIIHRDLKLDNVLLTGGNMNERVAKLADFGLHKRVRRMASSGALVPWSQDLTYHGQEYEKSYYGGKVYLQRSAMSVASSTRDDDSVAGGSMHGSVVGGSNHGGSSWHKASGATAALAAAASNQQPPGVTAAAGNGNNSYGGSSSIGRSSVPAADAAAAAAGRSSTGSKPPLPPSSGMPRSRSQVSLTGMANGTAAPAAAAEAPGSKAVSGAADAVCKSGSLQVVSTGTVQHSDSAASLPNGSSRCTVLSPSSAAAAAAGSLQQQQQQQQEDPMAAQQQELLRDVVRAKSQGLLGKQEFVTRVLAVPQAWQQNNPQDGLQGQDKEVARTFAAVQALEGSVRAGSAFYQQQQQDPIQQFQQQQQQQQPQQQQSHSQRFKLLAGRPRAELCPELVKQVVQGARQDNSQKFIEATQKVGSLMYMAPEVLIGHQYNEKIDVFSFGIILYELLSGVIVASRVALGGEHDELLDYARQVANGHREVIPTHWPAPVKQLISSCWAQEPKNRPTFKQVLQQLYSIKQAGLDVEMDLLRPRGNYNPVTDCGCSIM